jgi:hypothetical protein
VLASGYYFPTPRFDVGLMSGPALPVLGDLLSYTIAPIISWAILPAAFRKIFAPRAVPQRFKNQFPTSLALRPKQLRAAAEESALLIPTAAQLQALYPNIQCQVRIVHGDACRGWTVPTHLRYWQKQLPMMKLLRGGKRAGANLREK